MIKMAILVDEPPLDPEAIMGQIAPAPSLRPANAGEGNREWDHFTFLEKVARGAANP